MSRLAGAGAIIFAVVSVAAAGSWALAPDAAPVAAEEQAAARRLGHDFRAIVGTLRDAVSSEDSTRLVYFTTSNSNRTPSAGSITNLELEVRKLESRSDYLDAIRHLRRASERFKDVTVVSWGRQEVREAIRHAEAAWAKGDDVLGIRPPGQ